MTSQPEYCIVSPVKDEERHIRQTLRSVAGQTLLPALWIIVDDGSRDSTAAIVSEFMPDHPWIRLIRRASSSKRQPGSAVIRAFNRGLSEIKVEDFDFIVKLDCDLKLPPEYFQSIIEYFQKNPKLGIASGVYLEANNGSWQEVEMPDYHAAGASKIVQTRCFQEIGGFVEEKGWDTVDEIKAWTKGWETRHFTECKMLHLKPEGSGIGTLRTSAMHGEIYYKTGGGFLFFLFKCLRRLFEWPWVLGGITMLYGYYKARFQGIPLLVTPEEARAYRLNLNRRLKNSLFLSS